MTAGPDNKITKSEIKDALLRSGYLLESRVETILRKNWGYVEANPTYTDPDSGKSREYDIFALYPCYAGPNRFDFLFGVLLAECINNPQPLVILTKKPLAGYLHYEDVKISGVPVKILDGDYWQKLPEFLGMDNYHHYCFGRVGTQFCSFVRKKGQQPAEWMATHESSHYNAFQKLCDIINDNMDKHFKKWVFSEAEVEHVNIQMYYPVIILQGDLIDARETKRSVSLRSAEHLQFRRSVTVGDKELDYQIDIIQENYLQKYLSEINKEIQKTSQLLRRRHKVVRSSIDEIVAHAKDAHSPEQIREIMDSED